MESPVIEALRRVDAALARRSSYEVVTAALEEAEAAPDAEVAAYGIAQTRLVIASVFERPLDEFEAALREMLAVEGDPLRRVISAGAAYVHHAELVAYFDAAVAEVEALPRTPTVVRTLEFIDRCRANAAREQQRGEAGPTPGSGATPSG